MLPVNWLRRFKGEVARERDLAPLTTWRIGGPAELYLEPASVEELAETLHELDRVGMPFRLLGGGSNLLIADRGVRGAVLSLKRLRRVGHADGCLVAEAGAPLHWVVRYAASAGLSGAECLAGIPGNLGGAVFGNAGGRYGDIGSVVRALDLLEPDGRLSRVTPGPDFFRYRGSDVGNRIVLRAILALDEAAPPRIRSRNLEVVRERRNAQPGWVGNAGCVFRNPDAGSAGHLIDSAGCKGLREGGVFVSDRHANFIENDGTGRADDVYRLIERVRERVTRVHGTDLAMEVRRWR